MRSGEWSIDVQMLQILLDSLQAKGEADTLPRAGNDPGSAGYEGKVAECK